MSKANVKTAIDQMEIEFAALKVEAVKFLEKGNNSAGARVRANALKIRDLASTIRKEVSAAKNAEK